MRAYLRRRDRTPYEDDVLTGEGQDGAALRTVHKGSHLLAGDEEYLHAPLACFVRPRGRAMPPATSHDSLRGRPCKGERKPGSSTYWVGARSCGGDGGVVDDKSPLRESQTIHDRRFLRGD